MGKPSVLPINDTERIMDRSSTARGALADSACAILMQVSLAARVGRFDLLRAVGALASHVADWSETCDRYLHCLMCYINEPAGSREAAVREMGDLIRHAPGMVSEAGRWQPPIGY